MDKALASGAGDCGFESHRDRGVLERDDGLRRKLIVFVTLCPFIPIQYEIVRKSSQVGRNGKP